MTKEQFEHYIIGGKFKAIYNPTKTSDLSEKAKLMIGLEIVVYQNMLICPIQDDHYTNQHCFNSPSIYGWFPEEDITIKEILPETIDNPEPLPQYMYKLYYEDQDSIDANFGSSSELTPPFCAARNFSGKMDDYIMKLSAKGYQADRIERAIWKGEYGEKIEYKLMFEKQKPEHLIENHDDI